MDKLDLEMLAEDTRSMLIDHGIDVPADTIRGHLPTFLAAVTADRRTCAHPGDQEHDHEMCRDVVEEERAAAEPVYDPTDPIQAEAARRLADERGGGAAG